MVDFRFGALAVRLAGFFFAAGRFAPARLAVDLRAGAFFMLRLDFFFAPPFRAAGRVPPLRADFFLAAIYAAPCRYS
jgi:hypothetical protein